MFTLKSTHARARNRLIGVVAGALAGLSIGSVVTTARAGSNGSELYFKDSMNSIYHVKLWAHDQWNTGKWSPYWPTPGTNNCFANWWWHANGDGRIQEFDINGVLVADWINLYIPITGWDWFVFDDGPPTYYQWYGCP